MSTINLQPTDIRMENGNLVFKVDLPATMPFSQIQVRYDPPAVVEKPAEEKGDSDEEDNLDSRINDLENDMAKVYEMESQIGGLDAGIDELVSRVDKLEELTKKLTETTTSTEEKLTYHLREEEIDNALKTLKGQGRKYFFKNEVNDLEKKILTDMGYTIAYTTKDILPHHLVAAIEEDNYAGNQFLRNEHENVIIYKDPNRKGRGFLDDMNKVLSEWYDKERKKILQEAINQTKR